MRGIALAAVLLASGPYLTPSLVGAPADPQGPPLETGPFRTSDLVEVATLDPTIRLDVKYATKDNFAKRAVYEEARIFLQRPAAEALVRAHRALKPKGYGLLLFDGYRPWSVTKVFWDLTPPKDRIYVADPAKGSRHNRGCAIDLTLYDLVTGKAVEMPSEYDEGSPRSWVTFDGGDRKARELRDLLASALEREGFHVYPWEWWHHDYKDWADYPIGNIPFTAIASLPRPAAFPSAVDLASGRVVDLTWAFDEKTIYWPNAPSAFVKKADAFGKTPGGWFYSSNTICTPEHGGTHFDAPVHFGEGKPSTAEVPVRQLVGPAAVIDIAAKAAKDSDYRLAVADVTAWEARNGRVPRGAIVVLRTGWGGRYPDRKRYLGDDRPGKTTDLHFPSYGLEAARFLIEERGVGVIGVDTASIDYGPTTDFVVHRLAASKGVAGMENLANLDELPEAGAFLVALPMKIAGGSGGPLRVVAILPR